MYQFKRITQYKIAVCAFKIMLINTYGGNGAPHGMRARTYALEGHNATVTPVAQFALVHALLFPLRPIPFMGLFTGS